MATQDNVEDYLAALPDEFRIALEELRQTIQAVAPEATETISYQMPAFKYGGRLLMSYAAFKDHCSLFPMSKRVIETHAEELGPYMSGKGTIRFRPDDPLPAALVEELVRARIEEIAARGSG